MVLGGCYGPDWRYQRSAALATLDTWRKDQLAQQTSTKPSQTFMFYALCRDQAIFNGFGQHTANDLLHLLGFHPLMPTWVVCKDDTMFHAFRQGIEAMSDEWHSQPFLNRVAGEINSHNPFSYQYNMDKAYKASFVHVYRKIEACIRADLYRKLAASGLLDPNHIIGTSEAVFIACN